MRLLLVALALANGHHSLPAFAGCVPDAPQVRPSALLVTCADGTFFLAGLKWSRWGPDQAIAAGTAGRNSCVPDCRRGRVTARRIVVRLYRARICRNGRREFTRFTFTFVGGTHGATFKSPFYSGNGCP
jgi:hypothetical protein